MRLHRNFQTAPGARNLALGLDAPRWRFLGQAVRDGFMWCAAVVIFICALPFVSHWLRGML